MRRRLTIAAKVLARRIAIRRFSLILAIGLGILWLGCGSACHAQPPASRLGDSVPRDVREIYDRGLQYLVSTQTEAGSWEGGMSGPGVTGMALMVLLASGEDPNYGVYSNNIRRALRSMIQSQSSSTGFFGESQGHTSMYHHGFAMLALSEAYGTVDDRNLWAGNEPNRRSIGQSLELAVRCAITSQKKNQFGGWRYGPDATDADTSVSGAVLVGLLAARNAGIEVPDEAIDRAIKYYTQMTSSTSGEVGYSGGFGNGFGESLARTSIASLVFSIARRKDLPQYKATVIHLTKRLEGSGAEHYQEYTRYYQAQALFQGDVDAWEKWNKLLVRQLKSQQAANGSISGQFGETIGTALSLLSLAVNYRFLPIYER